MLNLRYFYTTDGTFSSVKFHAHRQMHLQDFIKKKKTRGLNLGLVSNKRLVSFDLGCRLHLVVKLVVSIALILMFLRFVLIVQLLFSAALLFLKLFKCLLYFYC